MTLALSQEQSETFNRFYHLPEIIARKIMRRRRYDEGDLEDAIQEGLIALCAAIRDYEPGSPLGINRHCSVRIRRRIIDSYRKRFGRTQKTHRFRGETGVLSLDVAAGSRRPVREQEQSQSATLEDRQSSCAFDHVESVDEIDFLFRGLSKLEQRAVRLYLVFDLKVREVGQAIGKCESRAFQMINDSLSHIRRHEKVGCAATGISGRQKVDPLLKRGMLGIIEDDGSIVTVRDYAAKTGRPIRRVHKMVEAGKLSTVVIGGRDALSPVSSVDRAHHGGLRHRRSGALKLAAA